MKPWSAKINLLRSTELSAVIRSLSGMFPSFVSSFTEYGLYLRQVAHIFEYKPPPQSGSFLLLKKGGGAYFREDTVSAYLEMSPYFLPGLTTKK
jgi:hypothetical protein